MSLTITQQKQLYEGLYDRIIDLHSITRKNALKEFTEYHRNKNHKGIVLLDYSNVKDMIESVKSQNFNYQWIPKNEASKIRHSSIPHAMLTMNAKTDCILVCSLSLNMQHLYIDCMKFKDIDT
jgi:hypothetical protein